MKRFANRRIDWEKLAPPASIPDEDVWTPDAVASRLIEAARICAVTGGSVLPAGIKGTMPAYAHDWADIEGQEPVEDRPRRLVSPKQMTRVEDAIHWPWRYLEAFEGPRRVLKTYLRCKALRLKFDEACRRKKWSRATAYRARDRALAIIAIGLTKDRVPIVWGDVGRRAGQGDDE